MKKLLIAILLLALLLGGLFLWLLADTGPDNAPQDLRVIELPDTYER